VHWAWGKLWGCILVAAKERAKDDKPTEIDRTSKQKVVSEAVLLDDFRESSALTAGAYGVDNFDKAREYYKEGQRAFDKALKFYVLDGYVTDHYNILADVSNLFKSLIFFETDDDRKCKMFRKRIDLLEPLAQELNPQAFVVIWKQITFELGEMYREIHDIKLKQQEETGKKVTPKKLFELASKGILYYGAFIKAYLKGDDELPEMESMDEDNLTWWITAHLSKARLHSKLWVPDPFKFRDNLKAALDSYTWIIDFAAKHDVKVLQQEIIVARQMLELLPIKIDNVTAQINAGKY